VLWARHGVGIDRKAGEREKREQGRQYVQA